MDEALLYAYQEPLQRRHWVGLSTDDYSGTELDRMETLSYAAVRASWFATPPIGDLDVAQRSFSQLP